MLKYIATPVRMKLQSISRKGVIAWTLLGFLLLCLSPQVTMAGKEDREGCTDHPLFNRLNNYYIISCQNHAFDRHRYSTEEGEIDVEGRYTYLDYRLQKDAPRVSSLQVIRNFTSAVEQAGGQILEERDGLACMKITYNGRPAWIQVQTSGNEGYQLFIVEETPIEQEIQIQSGGEQLGESGITGFVYPDLQIIDISYEADQDRLMAEVQNNGTPYSGPADVRVLAMQSLTGGYSMDRTTTVSLSLGPGEKVLKHLDVFEWNWPEEYPSLGFGVRIDPDDKIQESDENNNFLEKQLDAPCKTRIDRLQSTVTYEAKVWGGHLEFGIYGEFGDEQGAKVVALDEWTEIDRDNPSAPRELKERFLLPVTTWHNRGINVDLSSIDPGQYTVTIYCRDPSTGTDDVHHSNRKWLQIKKKREESSINWHDTAVRLFLGGWHPDDIFPFLDEGSPDSKKVADALADEFMENIEFNNNVSEILLQVETTATGVTTHCRYCNQDITTTVHKLFQNGQIFRSSENFHGMLNPIPEGSFWRSTFEFEAVPPGVYDYECTIIDRQGEEASLSTSFILNSR